MFLNSARAVQGVGAAIMFAVSLALLAQAFPNPKERAGALAAYGATIGASFAIGPLVGGLLTSGLDWQWIFLINIPIGIACLAITRAFVQESRDPSAHGIDWGGQITLTAGLGLLVLALLRGNEDGWTSTPIVAELIGAAVALVAFVIVRAARVPADAAAAAVPRRLVHGRADHGVRDLLDVLRDLPLRHDLPAADPRAVGDRGGPGVHPGHARHARRLRARPRSSGQKVPARTMIAGGLALVAIGMGALMVAGTESSWLVLMPGFMLACVGTGLFNPALTNVALSSVPQEMSGVAAGVNDTARQAGIAVGVAALGALIPAEHAFGGDPGQYVSGMHDALLVGGIVAAVGALAGWFLISSKYGAAAEAPAAEETQAARAARRCARRWTPPRPARPAGPPRAPRSPAKPWRPATAR